MRVRVRIMAKDVNDFLNGKEVPIASPGSTHVELEYCVNSFVFNGTNVRLIKIGECPRREDTENK